MQRKLTLTNRSGFSVDLMGDQYLLAEADNFGFSINSDYVNIGTQFVQTNSKFNQVGISGTLYFKGKDPYRDYFDLITNYTNTDLVLTYNTVKTFKLPCRLEVVNKKENTRDPRRVTITLYPLGLWYTEKSVISIPSVETTGKTYDYKYDYTYSDNTSGAIEIYSDTEYPSPVRLAIYGRSVDPVWRHYLDGEMIAEGKMINLTVDEDRKLSVDAISAKNDINIEDIRGNILNDVYQWSDFFTQRFLYLRKGTNRIVVAHAEASDLMFGVEAHLEYASV